MQSSYFKKVNNKNNLPDKPGVYFFQKGKNILYIGKATSLRSRTKSYFSKDLINTRGPLILDMVFKADKLKWEATDSVLEALILEANLIRKHKPYYNTREKDDKSFLCVIITKEAIPRVITARVRDLEQNNVWKNIKIAKIYGPFTSGTQLREAMKIVRKIFPFLDEKSKNYMEFYRQINLVPDINDKKLYLQNIKNIKLFFAGKKQQIFRNLKKEMGVYAKKHEFEKASEIKRQLFALQHINDIALLKQENFAALAGSGSGHGQNFPASSVRIEAYDIAHMSGKNMVGAMVVIENGEPARSEYKKFKIRTQGNANDTGALKEVLERRLAHTEWTYPNLIVVDGGKAQINAAHAILKQMKLKIPIVSVLKNERHKPKAIMAGKGNSEANALKYKKEILLANSEAHRFAIAYHKNIRNKNFLK
jgi:excinuclease ABC subunit C